MARPTHPRKEWERLLREAEDRGWRVDKGAGYFKCKCPADDKCFVSIPLTPSGSRTLINRRKVLERCVGWR